jgi:hypothetical protein
VKEAGLKEQEAKRQEGKGTREEARVQEDNEVVTEARGKRPRRKDGKRQEAKEARGRRQVAK